MWGKSIITGICKCGHDHMAHHGSMVMSEEVAKRIGTTRVAGECLAYGNNERGGDDELGRHHCSSYVDQLDDTRSWSGTVRKPGHRPLYIQFRLWASNVFWESIYQVEQNAPVLVPFLDRFLHLFGICIGG